MLRRATARAAGRAGLVVKSAILARLLKPPKSEVPDSKNSSKANTAGLRRESCRRQSSTPRAPWTRSAACVLSFQLIARRCRQNTRRLRQAAARSMATS